MGGDLTNIEHRENMNAQLKIELDQNIQKLMKSLKFDFSSNSESLDESPEQEDSHTIAL